MNDQSPISAPSHQTPNRNGVSQSYNFNTPGMKEPINSVQIIDHGQFDSANVGLAA